MARSLRSLRQVTTLRHGHMARRSALAFRALGVCEHIWLRCKNFDPSCFDPIQKCGMSTWGLTLISIPFLRPTSTHPDLIIRRLQIDFRNSSVLGCLVKQVLHIWKGEGVFGRMTINCLRIVDHHIRGGTAITKTLSATSDAATARSEMFLATVRVLSVGGGRK